MIYYIQCLCWQYSQTFSTMLGQNSRQTIMMIALLEPVLLITCYIHATFFLSYPTSLFCQGVFILVTLASEAERDQSIKEWPLTAGYDMKCWILLALPSLPSSSTSPERGTWQILVCALSVAVWVRLFERGWMSAKEWGIIYDRWILQLAETELLVNVGGS